VIGPDRDSRTHPRVSHPRGQGAGTHRLVEHGSLLLEVGGGVIQPRRPVAFPSSLAGPRIAGSQSQGPGGGD